MPSTPTYARNCPARDDHPPSVPDSARHTAGSHAGNHGFARFDSRFASAGGSIDTNGPAESVREVPVAFELLAKWSAGWAASIRKALDLGTTAIGGFVDDRAIGEADSSEPPNGLGRGATKVCAESAIAESGFGVAQVIGSPCKLVASECSDENVAGAVRGNNDADGEDFTTGSGCGRWATFSAGGEIIDAVVSSAMIRSGPLS